MNEKRYANPLYTHLLNVDIKMHICGGYAYQKLVYFPIDLLILPMMWLILFGDLSNCVTCWYVYIQDNPADLGFDGNQKV